MIVNVTQNTKTRSQEEGKRVEVTTLMTSRGRVRAVSIAPDADPAGSPRSVAHSHPPAISISVVSPLRGPPTASPAPPLPTALMVPSAGSSFSMGSISSAPQSALTAHSGGQSQPSQQQQQQQLSRHDLILEEDLPRVLEAYFAVDEHRRMTVDLTEAEEILRLVNVKADRAALQRVPSANSEDDVRVQFLRRTGASLPMALSAGVRQWIGCPTTSALTASVLSSTSSTQLQHGTTTANLHASPRSHRSNSSAGGAGAAFAPPTGRRLTQGQQQGSGFHRALSASQSSNGRKQLSFLSLMRLLFPSYPRKAVEKAAIALLPTPPQLPSVDAQEVTAEVRLLFRGCRSAIAGIIEDRDDGIVTFDMLMRYCRGMDATHMAELVLRHSSAMKEYYLNDLIAFESLRVYDLLRHIGFPALVVHTVQQHRFQPPLSMVSLMMYWDVLRQQMQSMLTLALETRVAQAVVMMRRHGIPSVFRCSWSSIVSERDAETAPEYDLNVEMQFGVDGLTRHPIDVSTVELTIHQLAMCLAEPRQMSLVLEPHIAPQSQRVIDECRQKGGGRSRTDPYALKAAARQPRSGRSLNGSSPPPSGSATPKSTSSPTNLTPASSPRNLTANAAAARQPRRFGGTSLDAWREANASVAVSSGMRLCLPDDASAETVLKAIGVQQQDRPAAAIASDGDVETSNATCNNNSSNDPSDRSKTKRFPNQSAVRLSQSARYRKAVLKDLDAKFQVSFERQVESVGPVQAYYEPQSSALSFGAPPPPSSSASPRHRRESTTAPAQDVLVFAPRATLRGDPRAVRPLSGHQRKCTHPLWNFHRADEEEPLMTRHNVRPPPATARPMSAASRLVTDADGCAGMRHMVSRPLGFTGVVVPQTTSSFGTECSSGQF